MDNDNFLIFFKALIIILLFTTKGGIKKAHLYLPKPFLISCADI